MTQLRFSFFFQVCCLLLINILQSFQQAFGKDGSELPIAQITAPIGFLLAFALEKCLLSGDSHHHGSPPSSEHDSLTRSPSHDADLSAIQVLSRSYCCF